MNRAFDEGVRARSSSVCQLLFQGGHMNVEDPPVIRLPGQRLVKIVTGPIEATGFRMGDSEPCKVFLSTPVRPGSRIGTAPEQCLCSLEMFERFLDPASREGRGEEQDHSPLQSRPGIVGLSLEVVVRSVIRDATEP